MEVRFCDLDLKIEGSEIEPFLAAFYNELEKKNIVYRPAVYLSDEWLCPEGVPAIGIPFYLCHPRLKRLEKQLMLEIEGDDKEEFLRLMRHEMGHAISYAYKFQNKKKWRSIFGHPSKEFSDYYKYKKYSRSFVSNIEEGYAQSHPDEDFAETFAVWLAPDTNWTEKYRGWRVMRKLDYVNELMNKINDSESFVRPSTRSFNIRLLKSRLRTHYKKKRQLYAQEYPDFYDPEIMEIFVKNPDDTNNLRADRFIRQSRKEIISSVKQWTGQRKYVVYYLLKKFIERTKQEKLYCKYDQPKTLMMIVSCLTSLMKNHYYTGMFKGGLGDL